MASNILVSFLFGGNASGLQTAAQQANAALNSTNRSLIENRARFLAATAVVSGFAAGLTGVVKSLIETSAEFQRLGTSFVSILAEPLLDAKKGAAITKENLEGLRVDSVNLFREAQRAAVDTVATTKEYVTLLQAALAIGQQQGLTQEQTLIITKRLALAAGAFGIDFEKASSAIAQILSGSVRVTNQLGRNLGLATGEQRRLLKASIDSGTLFDFLEKKTRNFSATAKEVADNFLNVKAAVFDIFQLGGTAAARPLFDFLNKQLIQFRDTFIGTGTDSFFTPALQRIIAGFQDFFKQIIPALLPLSEAFGNLFGSVGGRSSEIATSFKVVLAILTAIVNLLAQAISLKGLGGFLVLVTAIRFGLREIALLSSGGAVLASLVAGYRNLTNNIVLATAATSTFGRTTAILAVANVFLRIATVVFIVVEAIRALSSSTEDAAVEFEKLNRQTEQFSETQREFAKNRNLQDLIDDYKRLTEQQTRTYDEAKRLEEVTQLLERAFGKAGFAAFAAGKAAEGLFEIGQAALNQQLEARIQDLQKLKDALDIIAQGKPSLFFGGSPEDVETVQKQLERFAVAEAAINSLKQIFPELKNLSVDSADGIDQFRKAIENLIDPLTKQRKAQLLLEKSYKELIDGAYESAKADSTSEEGKKRLGEFSAALYKGLLREQEAHGLTGKAAREAAKAAAEASLEKVKSAVISTTALSLENDELIKQVELYSLVSIEAALALDKRTELEEKRKKLAFEQDQLERTIARLTQRAPSGTTGTSRGTTNRDELKDFLAEIERQLGFLKKASDGIEKEVEKILGSTRKLVRELGDAGVIASQDAFDLEIKLVNDALKIQQDLTQGQLDFVEDAIKLGEQIADRTEKAAARAKERVAGKTPGSTRARGGEGIDTRDRNQELLKLSTEEVALLNKLGESFRKAEEFRTDSLQHNVAQRILLRKSERDNLDEAAKSQAETAAAAQEALRGLGLLSQEALVRAGIARTEAQSERDKQDLVLQLFPLADPKIRDFLLNSLNELAVVVESPVAASASKLLLNLITAGTNPIQLEEFRKTIQDSINNGGLIEQLIQQRLGAYNQLLAAKEKVAAATKVLEDFDKLLALGAKPEPSKRNEIVKTLADYTEELAKVSIATPQAIDDINRVIELLKQVGVSDVDRGKIQQNLDSLEEKSKQKKIDGLKEIVAAKEKELELQFKLLDFDSQRLDILEQLNQREQELGIKTKFQANAVQLSLIREREHLLLLRQQGLSAELGAINSNVEPGSAQAEQRRQLQLDLVQLNVQLFELRNKAFDLTSPLVAARDAFKEVGDAVRNLPTPQFDEFTKKFKGLPFAQLAGVFDGLSKLAEVLANQSRPKAPDVVLKEASTNFQGAVTGFQIAVNQLQDFIEGLLGGQGGLPPATPDRIGLPSISTDPAVKRQASITASSIIRAAGNAVSAILAGISQGGAGGLLTGAGGAISAISGLFKGVAGKALPIIGAAFEIFGGVVSFFAARAKQKTHEIAETITSGVEELKHAMSTGAVGLGDGVRQLRAQLESARRQLSGKKGGKEELKKIEDNINAEIQALKDRAAEIQKDFKSQLELLRAPVDLRDLITKIKAIEDTAKAYLASFESIADAQAAAADVEEFVRRSIEELKQTTDAVAAADTSIQTDFRKALERLRSPSGLRDTIDAINAISDQARAFLESFPTAAEATAALGEAQEFIRLSLEQLEGEIRKALIDLQQNLTDITNQFIKDQHDILLEGRIDPRISEAESKRRRLVELAERFAKEKKAIEEQIAAEKQKLEFAQSREALEQEIAKFTERAADKMGDAADKLSDAADKLLNIGQILDNIFKSIAGFNFVTPPLGGGGFVGGGDGENGGNPKIILDFKLNGASIGQQEVGIGSQVQLEMAGLLSGSKLNKFNPTTTRRN